MMVKQIFSDLDGTLYNDGVISEEDKEAIAEIVSRGATFNVATGRIFPQAHEIVKGAVDVGGYYICENGALIYDKDSNLVYRGTIDDDLVKKVISSFKSDKADLFFKYKGNAVVLGEDTNFKLLSNDYVVEPDFLERDGYDNMIGNIGVASGSPEELDRVAAHFAKEFGDELEIFLSSEYTLNIAKRGVSKKNAIEKVCGILGVGLDEVATFGDSQNDVSMLEGFANSFAMEKATDEVKKSASWTVSSVADGIEILNKSDSNLAVNN